MIPSFINPDDHRGIALWWIIRLTADDMGEEEYQEFRRWWLSDPRHSEAFAVETGWRQQFQALLTPEIRARCAALCAEQVSAGKPRSRRMIQYAIAAAVVAATVIGGFVLRNGGSVSQSYATQTGQSRTVTFQDGSVAYLNTRTRIRWLGGTQERHVALLEGEALFEVAPDPAHAFHVSVDRSEIRVLGTRFNVYRKPSGETLVTVLEGTVEVRRPADAQHASWRQVLGKDQQATYSAADASPVVRQTDALRAVKWREGAADINNQPLSEAIEELSRYTDQRIVAADPRLRSITINAILQVHNAHESLTRLAKVIPIAVGENQNVITLTYREPAISQR